MNRVYEILSATPLGALMDEYNNYTQESVSTASIKRNELRSFGTDLNYAPHDKAKKAVETGPVQRETRSQRKKRAANAVTAPVSNDSVGVFAESISAGVGAPPNT